MSNKPVKPGDLQSLWQSMPTPQISLSADEIRARALAFDRKVRHRNRTEYVAAAVVVAAFTWFATWPKPATPLWPIANLMIVAGTLLVAWNLHRIARAAAPPTGASAGSLIDFQRAQYVRQRDALNSVWLWYIAPIVPGMILWYGAIWTTRPSHLPEVGWTIVVMLAVSLTITVFAGIAILNRIVARRLQRMIDDLDSYKE